MDSSCLPLVRKARKQIHTSPRALHQWLRDGNWCRKFLTSAALHGIILRHVFHRFPEFHSMMALRSSAGAAGGSPPPPTSNNTPRVHYLPFAILFFHCPTGFLTPHINYLLRSLLQDLFLRKQNQDIHHSWPWRTCNLVKIQCRPQIT